MRHRAYQARRFGQAAIPPLAGLAVVLLVAGCAADLAPGPAESPRASVDVNRCPPPVLEVPSDETGGGATANLVDIPESEVEPVIAPRTGLVISQTALVSAGLGGIITAGRHTLVISPGALKKDTEITVVDVTGAVGYVECELYPEGLRFKEDVTLVSVTSDLRSPADLTTYWIYKVNEKKLARDLGGVESIGGVGVLVHLEHFSTYRIGKAGW